MYRTLQILFFFLIAQVAFAEQGSPLRLPSELRFAENKGQWADFIRYKADLTNGRLMMEGNRFTFLFWKEHYYDHGHGQVPADSVVYLHAFKIDFVNANPKPALVPATKESFYQNYYLGNNPAHWASNVGLFKQLTYRDLYNGIDVAVYGSGNRFEYEYRVAAGTDPAQIQVRYEGVDDLKIQQGELHYKLSLGTVRELAPFAYQIVEGKRVEVKCRYQLSVSEGTLSFVFPNGYDSSRELIIDPTLIFSSYTGSTADNFGFSSAYDKEGNFYAGGNVYEYRSDGDPTAGTGTYPRVGAFQSTFQGGDQDIAISKFDSLGNSLIFSTYLGGSGTDLPHSLVVNNQDELYVFGTTGSTNFPVSANGYSRTYNGGVSDICITKFSPIGAMIGSTFIGGSGEDGRNIADSLNYNFGDSSRGQIIVDSFSNVYVTASTWSTNFPTNSMAFQQTNSGGQDACVFKLSSDLSTLFWSSYLGGSNDDAGYSVKLDKNKNVLVAGGTWSTDFPTTRGSFHKQYQGGQSDGFIANIKNDGTIIQKCTYIGTSSYDQCHFIEVDVNNNVYLVGQTLGAYPVSSGVYSNANTCQFIQILDNNLSASLYSTVFGSGSGAVNISPTAFLVDKCFNLYVSGWGGIVNHDYHNPATGYTFGLPTTSNALQPTTDGSDMYFIVFTKNLATLLYGSFYGGRSSLEHVDGGTCQFDKNGIIYSAVCAGCGGNSLFPTTPGAYSRTNRSLNCNMAALKIDLNLAGTSVAVQATPRATGCVPLTVNFRGVTYNVTDLQWNFGDGSALSTSSNPVHTYIDTGHFTVQLVGHNSNSCNVWDTAYIDVWVRNDSLNTNFLQNTIINCHQKEVRMSVQNFPTTQYQWDMGDGTALLTTPTVDHFYTNPGHYTVRLTVTDTTKCDLQKSFSADVFVPPTVHIQYQPSDTTGCTPLTVHFNNTTNSTGNFYWSFGNGDSSRLKSPTYTYLHQGVFRVQLIMVDSNTCNINDTAYALITPFDSAADAQFHVVRQFYGCDSVKILVYSTYRGEDREFWNFGDGTTSTGDTLTHVYSAPAFDTITHILWDAKKVCHPIDTNKIIITLNPWKVAMHIADTLGCLPFTANFKATSQLFTTAYYWFFGDGDSAIGDTVNHTYTAVGTYRVRLVGVDSNACILKDTVYGTVTVINDSVHAAFTIQTLHACDSDLHIQLQNQSLNNVVNHWSFGDGTNSDSTNPVHHYRLPGTYTIRLIVQDSTRCHPLDTAYQNVTLKPNAVANFAAPNQICQHDSICLPNSSKSGIQTFWNFGDNSNSTVFSPCHRFDSAGTLTIQLVVRETSTCNVWDTMKRQIIVHELPIADFSTITDTFNFETPVVFLNHSLHYNTSFWTFGDGDTSSEDSPTHIYDHTIKWMRPCLVVYIDGVSCRDTICKQIYIDFKKLIGVPNAFSPNGDGQNDFAWVEGKGIIELDFKIYNRWGEKVFESHDQKAGWDGTYKGTRQDMDTYIYTVSATLIDGENVVLKGNITLLR